MHILGRLRDLGPATVAIESPLVRPARVLSSDTHDDAERTATTVRPLDLTRSALVMAVHGNLCSHASSYSSHAQYSLSLSIYLYLSPFTSSVRFPCGRRTQVESDRHWEKCWPIRARRLMRHRRPSCASKQRRRPRFHAAWDQMRRHATGASRVLETGVTMRSL